MFRKNKEKRVRTMKVGTHRKSVIALWFLLIGSVSFGIYKNFTAIDQHTTHKKEIIQLNDTSGIENFVKDFARAFYGWKNNEESIQARTEAISNYLTPELQDLNTVLLTRLFQIHVLKDSYGTEEIFNFIRDFRIVKVSDRKYINLTKSSSFIKELKTQTGLPLTSYFLKNEDINNVLSHRF